VPKVTCCVDDAVDELEYASGEKVWSTLEEGKWLAGQVVGQVLRLV